LISNGQSSPIAAVTRPTHPFHTAFVVAMLIVSFPIKNLAYIAPLVYLAYQARRGDPRLIVRVSLVSLAAVLVSGLALLGVSYYGQVNVPGMFLAIFTYLPLIIALCHPPVPDLSEGDIERLQTACAWFVIIQSAIGVLQFGISGNPDAVCGTFGLFDFREENITISQVYLTFTLFSLILFMFLDARRRLVQVAICVGLLTCVLAQSGHQTIFFVATLGAAGLSRVTQPKIAAASFALVVVMALLVDLMYPETRMLAVEWSEKVLDANSPKGMVVESGLELMGDPATLVFGTGLGQYSSRAALISSNEYLSTRLPDVFAGKSSYFAQHVEPANELFALYGEGSALSKPYFSLLSICVETGLLGSLLLGGAVVVQMFRNLRLMRCQHPWASLCGLLANAGIVFFVLCCAVENYAEFAQAIFLPALLYVAATSWAETLTESQERCPPRTAAALPGPSMKAVP
jgi:hypothetical protein